MVSDMRFPVYWSGRLRSSPSLFVFRVFRRISRRRANRDLYHHLDLAHVPQAHRIADKVILDRANLSIRIVSMGDS
jgi:hypothetical protein